MTKKKTTTAPGQEKKAEQRPRKLLTDQNVPTYYSNTVEIASSGADFRIRLGEIVDASPEELLIRHRATIFFSPRHAKEVALLFARKIKEHEEKYGVINPTE